MSKPTPTEFLKADDYLPGERIVSKLTRRCGMVMKWPEGQPRPAQETSLWGAIWVKWDDGKTSHAWRHQVNRA